MQKLVNWDAKRSGATMTVSGVDADTGKPVRFTNVVSIGVRQVHPTSTRRAVCAERSWDGLRALVELGME